MQQKFFRRYMQVNAYLASSIGSNNIMPVL